MKTLTNPKYTFVRGNVYYFSKSIPVDLRSYYSSTRIVQSLKTRSFTKATTASRLVSAKLEDYWLGLRLKKKDVPAAHLLLNGAAVNDLGLLTIEDALELYLTVIGKGRQKQFFTTAKRYIGYLIECLGSRPVDKYSSRDAVLLREWLLKKGLSHSSLQRIFSGIKAVINFVILELGLECQNAFSRVYLPSHDNPKKRHAISERNMTQLKQQCLDLDDDIRWLVAIIFDTGMRLSEAAGLMFEDLKLDHQVPHVVVRPHPHRRLKTSCSKRKIPLVGMSLWAAKRLNDSVTGSYCFPRYTDGNRCNSNSASAAINKWIKLVAARDDVVHGLRHSFRDRLRAIETPNDMIDQLGGWSLKSVGESYGDGYQLELMSSYMSKMIGSE